MEIVSKVLCKGSEIVFKGLVRDRVMNALELAGGEPSEAESTMLQLGDKIGELMEAILQLLDNAIPDGDVVVKIFVGLFLLAENLEC